MENLSEKQTFSQLSDTMNKLKKLFGIEIFLKNTDKVMFNIGNKQLDINDIEFSLISPTGIELLVVRLHNNKIGSMRCGDQIMNLSIN